MLSMNDYQKRRETLIQMLEPNSIVIIPSAKEIIRNGDAVYPFRQNSDFYYLTGLEEPDAVLILAPNRKEGEYILFNRVRDRSREIWDGPRTGQEGAVKEYLADQAYPIEQFKQMLPDLLIGRNAIYYPIGKDKDIDRKIMRALNKVREKVRGGLVSPAAFIDVGTLLHEMRLIKTKAEAAVMQKAVDITANGHIRAMKACRPGMYEYELEAEILYEFKKNGAKSFAYTPIVGAGPNSCVLHYVNNHAQIKSGDLVLIDAGAEYQNYAADITRTFPANGKFNQEQRAIYELVLSAQEAAIKAVKPGESFMAAQTEIVNIITEGLRELGLLKGDRDELIESQAYFPFYMHRSGHWLGLDVHDVGRYSIDNKWRNLEAGMVITIEPGIYISADIPDVPKQWHNIGVRIEDDILITETGCKVLSSKIPKQVDEIENLMASG